MDGWKQVWNQRTLDVSERPTLADVLQLDGYDQGAGAISVADWQAYVMRRVDELGITPGSSIFEIGCGAGAFLWPLYERGYRVSGVDYAGALIAWAQQAMPQGHWQVVEANQPLPAAAFDATVATSVFHYFPHEAYAAQVLRNMVNAARQAVGIFDVPDARVAVAAEASRRALLGEAEYTRRYADLHHLTLTADWFRARTPAGWVVQIQPQDIPTYGNNPYRFNVIMKRDG